ncbi:MAG: flagellar export chaperone FlgN [Leifsonia sp.]
MGATELSAVLWHERELLELLLFKLEEQQLLLTAGKSRWIPFATREIEQVAERLRESGLGRSVELDTIAAEWGVAPEVTLRQLAEAAPPGPWGDILRDHLAAMTDLTTEITAMRDLNDALLRSALRSTQEVAAGIDGDSGTYDAHGTTSASAGGARIIDREL